MWKNNSQRSGRFQRLLENPIATFEKGVQGVIFENPQSFFIYNAAENIKTDMVI